MWVGWSCRCLVPVLALLIAACGTETAEPPADAGPRKDAADAGSSNDASDLPQPDGGASDAASSDAKFPGDAASPDAEPGDAGVPDAEPPDGHVPDAEVPDGCTALELAQDAGAHDFDVTVTRLTGTLTLGGAPLPTTNGSRGRLEIEDADGERTSLELGETGSFGFDVGLPPGTYAVRYRPNAGACAEPEAWPMPCEPVDLRPALSVLANMMVSLDLPTPPARAQISGEVTLDGAPFPSGSRPRGSIVFSSASGDFDHELGTSGAALYDVHLPPDTYEVRYEGNPAHCLTAPASAVPCNDALLDPAFVIASNGTASFDVESVRVQGEVRVNGAAMQSSGVTRGRLVFIGALSRSFTHGLGTAGAATYDVRLTRGTYAVDFKANGCPNPTPIPCHDGEILASTTINADTTLDLDIPAVWISGEVLANGAPLQDAPAARGRVRFVSQSARATSSRLPATGPATYAVALFPGTYDLHFLGNPDLCESGGMGVPCNGGQLSTGHTFGSNTTMNVDLPVATVAGTVTVDGASFPAEPVDRGAVVFKGANGSYETPSLGAAGPASFSVSLLHGTYDVRYRPNEALCTSASTPLPCREGPPLRTAWVLSSDAAPVFDLDVVRISGEVRVNGAEMPGTSGTRGRVVFDSTSDTGTFESLDFGVGGPAEFSVVVYRDDYDVRFIADSDTCRTTPEDAGPCMDATLATGLTIASPAWLPFDMSAVRAFGTVTANGALLQPGVDPGALEVTSTATGEGATLGIAADGSYAAWLPTGEVLVKHLPGDACTTLELSCFPQHVTEACEAPSPGGPGGGSGCVTEAPAYAPGEIFAFEGGSVGPDGLTTTVLSNTQDASGASTIDIYYEHGNTAYIITHILSGGTLAYASTQLLSPNTASIDYTPPYPAYVLPLCVGDTIPVSYTASGATTSYTMVATAYEAVSLPVGSVQAVRLEYEVNGTTFALWVADDLGQVKYRTGTMPDLTLTEHVVP